MKRGERDIFATIVDAARAGRHVYLSPEECAILAKHPDIATGNASALAGEWKIVLGYPRYEVSSDGRVRHGGRLLRPTRARSGHLKVTIYNGTPHGTSGRGRRVQVHHLVALSFIGPPPFEGAIIRHRNGYPEDNTVANLVWGTHEENTQDRVRHLKFGKPTPVDRTWTRPLGRFRFRRKSIQHNEIRK